MKHKKVLFVIGNLELGGIQKVNVEIAEGLTNRGYHVEFAIMNQSEVYFQTKIKCTFFDIKKSLPIYIRKFIRKIRTSLLNIETSPYFIDYKKVKLLNEFLENKEFAAVVINAESIPLIPFIKTNKAKIISWTHNSADIYLNDYFKREKSYLIKGLEESDVVIALTEESRALFKKYNSSTICVYNPLTIDHSYDRYHSCTRVISLVGRIDVKHKGLDYLVKIANLLPEGWKISIAGDGDSRNKSDFQRQIEKYGVSKKIEIKGALKGKKLEEHYLNSSIYLMTSRWEGMPLVLAEAMSFGLPIVSSNNSGAVEVLKNGEFGLLYPIGNINSAYSQIEKLIVSEEERDRYSKLSLKRLEDFNLEKILNKWEVIIER